jgi:hypothetical protein
MNDLKSRGSENHVDHTGDTIIHLNSLLQNVQYIPDDIIWKNPVAVIGELTETIPKKKSKVIALIIVIPICSGVKFVRMCDHQLEYGKYRKMIKLRMVNKWIFKEEEGEESKMTTLLYYEAKLLYESSNMTSIAIQNCWTTFWNNKHEVSCFKIVSGSVRSLCIKSATFKSLFTLSDLIYPRKKEYGNGSTSGLNRARDKHVEVDVLIRRPLFNTVKEKLVSIASSERVVKDIVLKQPRIIEASDFVTKVKNVKEIIKDKYSSEHDSKELDKYMATATSLLFENLHWMRAEPMKTCQHTMDHVSVDIDSGVGFFPFLLENMAAMIGREYDHYVQMSGGENEKKLTANLEEHEAFYISFLHKVSTCIMSDIFERQGNEGISRFNRKEFFQRNDICCGKKSTYGQESEKFKSTLNVPGAKDAFDQPFYFSVGSESSELLKDNLFNSAIFVGAFLLRDWPATLTNGDTPSYYPSKQNGQLKYPYTGGPLFPIVVAVLTAAMDSLQKTKKDGSQFLFMIELFNGKVYNQKAEATADVNDHNLLAHDAAIKLYKIMCDSNPLWEHPEFILGGFLEMYRSWEFEILPKVNIIYGIGGTVKVNNYCLEFDTCKFKDFTIASTEGLKAIGEKFPPYMCKKMGIEFYDPSLLLCKTIDGGNKTFQDLLADERCPLEMSANFNFDKKNKTIFRVQEYNKSLK